MDTYTIVDFIKRKRDLKVITDLFGDITMQPIDLQFYNAIKRKASHVIKKSPTNIDFKSAHGLLQTIVNFLEKNDKKEKIGGSLSVITAMSIVSGVMVAIGSTVVYLDIKRDEGMRYASMQQPNINMTTQGQTKTTTTIVATNEGQGQDQTKAVATIAQGQTQGQTKIATTQGQTEAEKAAEAEKIKLAKEVEAKAESAKTEAAKAEAAKAEAAKTEAAKTEAAKTEAAKTEAAKAEAAKAEAAKKAKKAKEDADAKAAAELAAKKEEVKPDAKKACLPYQLCNYEKKSELTPENSKCLPHQTCGLNSAVNEGQLKAMAIAALAAGTDKP